MHEREAIDQEDKDNKAEVTATTTAASVEPYAPAGKSTKLQLTGHQRGMVMRALEREGLTPASEDIDGWREYAAIHYYNSRLKVNHYGLFRVPSQVHFYLSPPASSVQLRQCVYNVCGGVCAVVRGVW